MKKVALGNVGLISAALVGVWLTPLFASDPSQPESQDGVVLPAGYRNWALISVARVGTPLNDLRAKLGNDIAIEAFRENIRPFPDGAIIARLAYKAVVSEENNAVFRVAAEQQGLTSEQIAKLLAESVVSGPAVNVQIMIKDAKKYAATGGWGFAQFDNGKPADVQVTKTCFPCHAPGKTRDFVFTRYAP